MQASKIYGDERQRTPTRGWGLHPGADNRSSDEAGRADGAGGDTENGERRHGGSVDWTGVNWEGGGEGRVDRDGEGRRAKMSCTRLDFAGGVVSRPEALKLSHHADMARDVLISNTRR